MPNPFDHFNITVPTYNTAGLQAAAQAIVTALQSFEGNPSGQQLAEAVAQDFGAIVRKLSLLGA